jgi:uncharacterized membrane protein YjfL (UPF0719 family)
MIMETYSRKERIMYHSKRHVPGFLIALVGFVLAYELSDSMWLSKSLELIASGIVRVGVFASLFLLVQKFAFPKLDLQNIIGEHSTATAIFLGLIALAIASVIR